MYFDIESAWEIEASKMFGPLSGLRTEFSLEVQQYTPYSVMNRLRALVGLIFLLVNFQVPIWFFALWCDVLAVLRCRVLIFNNGGPAGTYYLSFFEK